MVNKINNWIYGNHFFFAHFLICSVLCGMFVGVVSVFNLFPLEKFSELVNSDIISLSATVAGFEFAGVSILISLDGNKKMQVLKKIDEDSIIYKIFIYSIVAFLISIIIMVSDINLLKYVNVDYSLLRHIFQSISIYFFALGFLFFLSSMKLMSWMLKK